MAIDERPRALAHMKDNGGCYGFTGEHYAALYEAWTNGRAFFTGPGPDGETVTLKLAGVECVVHWHADALATTIARTAAEAAEEKRRTLFGEGT